MEGTLNRDILEDTFLPSPSPSIKINNVVYTRIEAEDKISGYFVLTGRFPQRLSQGNQYLMVGYHYDANLILGIPIQITQLHQWLMLGKNYTTKNNWEWYRIVK